MASFYYVTLNKELKKSIYAKALSPEQLKDVYARIKQNKDKQKKVIKIVMLCITIMSILMDVVTFQNRHDPELFVFMLLLTIPLIVIICALVYFSQIGIITIQFNRAIEKSYPELAGKLKL